MSYVDRSKKEFVLRGDASCGFEKSCSYQNAKHIINFYGLFALKRLIEELTSVSLNAPTIIDHIATAHFRNIFELGVINHYMFYCTEKLHIAFEIR